MASGTNARFASQTALSVALDRLKDASKDIEAAHDAVIESARSKDVVETYGTYAADCENCPGWDPLRKLLGTILSTAITHFERNENKYNTATEIEETKAAEIDGLNSFNASLEMCIERALIWRKGSQSHNDGRRDRNGKAANASTDDGENDNDSDGEDDELASFKVYEKHCGNAVVASRNALVPSAKPLSLRSSRKVSLRPILLLLKKIVKMPSQTRQNLLRCSAPSL